MSRRKLRNIRLDDAPEKPSPAWVGHVGAAVMGAAIFLGVVIYFARQWTPVVLAGLCTDGLAAVAWIAAAALAGDTILTKLGFFRESDEGPLRWPSAAALGLGLFSLIILGLGLAGWVNRATMLGLPLASIFAWGARFLPRPVRRQRVRVKVPPDSVSSIASFIWLAAVPFLAMAATAASLMPGWLWKPDDPAPYDVTSYHLEIARQWCEAGRIFSLHHNVFSFFPMNQEMHYLAGMSLYGGSWKPMYFCQYFSVIVMSLMVMAVWALVVGQLGSEKPGRRLAAGAIAGVTAASVPWIVMLGSMAYVESAFLLYGILSAAWVIRAVWRHQNSLRAFALAGVFAGLAGGAKYTAVPMIFLAVPIALVIARPRPWRKNLAAAALFCAAGFFTLSPWLLRNWIWCGNPIFPLAMKLLGHGDFRPIQVQRFIVAHSPTPGESAWPSRLRVFGQTVLGHWQYAYVALPAGVLAAATMCRRFAGRFLLAILLIQFIVWIGFTHLLGRFFVPAIPLAAAAIGWRLRGRWLWAGFAVAAACVVAGLATLWPVFDSDLAARDLAAGGVVNPRILFLCEGPAVFDTVHAHKLAMIGDAMPYVENLPAADILYRNVFDVYIPPGEDVVDAWLGQSVEQLRRQGYTIEINFDELDRFSKTYLGIPAATSKYRPHGEMRVLLDPK